MMTEQGIIIELARKIDNRKYPFQIPNAFIYQWESDYWVLDSNGITKEFEIKISRADFFNDCKKEKHKECYGANYFYYVCPKDLIKKNEVDPKYGLIYIWETGHVSIEKRPKKLNDNRFDKWQMLANKMYWRWRQIWKQKWIDKEITFDEYASGFNIQLELHET